MRYFKSWMFAAFVASAAITVGCGETEAEPGMDGQELKSQKSGIKSSPHCPVCSDYEQICCESIGVGDVPYWGCSTTPEPCNARCPDLWLPIGGHCVGEYCVPNDRKCEPLH